MKQPPIAVGIGTKPWAVPIKVKKISTDEWQDFTGYVPTLVVYDENYVVVTSIVGSISGGHAIFTLTDGFWDAFGDAKKIVRAGVEHPCIIQYRKDAEVRTVSGLTFKINLTPENC